MAASVFYTKLMVKMNAGVTGSDIFVIHSKNILHLAVEENFSLPYKLQILSKVD